MRLFPLILLASIVSIAFASPVRSQISCSTRSKVLSMPRGGAGQQLGSLKSGGASKAIKQASNDKGPTQIIGNVFNVLAISGSIKFVLEFLKKSNPFDPIFNNDGFCVKNRFHHFDSSHALCFYIDIVLAFTLKWLLKKYKTQIDERYRVSTYLNPSLFSATLVHGAGHMLISFLDKENPTDATTVELLITSAAYFLVFYTTYQAAGPKFSHLDAALARTKTIKRSVDGGALILALLSALFWLVTPGFQTLQVGFTYVQTLIMSYACAVQLLAYPSSEKMFAYAAWAVVVMAGIVAVGWAIALDCSSPVIAGKTFLDIYGHIWYDSYLAISYMLFLWICLNFMEPEKVVKKKK